MKAKTKLFNAGIDRLLNYVGPGRKGAGSLTRDQFNDLLSGLELNSKSKKKLWEYTRRMDEFKPFRLPKREEKYRFKRKAGATFRQKASTTTTSGVESEVQGRLIERVGRKIESDMLGSPKQHPLRHAFVNRLNEARVIERADKNLLNLGTGYRFTKGAQWGLGIGIAAAGTAAGVGAGYLENKKMQDWGFGKKYNMMVNGRMVDAGPPPHMNYDTTPNYDLGANGNMVFALHNRRHG